MGFKILFQFWDVSSGIASFAFGSESSSAPSPVNLSRKAQSHQAKVSIAPTLPCPWPHVRAPSPYTTATVHLIACCAKTAEKQTLFLFLLGNTISFSMSVRDMCILKVKFPGELPVTTGCCVIQVSGLIM